MPVRGNGLSASFYAAVADLDPRAADVLLEILREAGVAAYAEPSQGRRGPYLDVHLPSRPTDRLFVDRAQHERARELLAEQLPALRGLNGGDVDDDEPPLTPSRSDLSSAEDEAFGRIVADFHQPTADRVPRWPVQEDVEPGAEPSPDTFSAVAGGPATGRTERPGRAEDDDHFIPPTPPPLPRPDSVTGLAWTALLGGPALLLISTLAGWSLPRFLIALAVVGFIAGFVGLVARMGNRRGEDWESDSGAVL